MSHSYPPTCRCSTRMSTCWRLISRIFCRPPRASYIAQTALTKLRVREQNPLLIPIHRLDRPTAGVLLFAKTVEARRPFQMMFQHRQVSKTYRAVAPVPADAAAAEQALSAEGLQVRSHIQKIRDQLQVQPAF